MTADFSVAIARLEENTIVFNIMGLLCSLSSVLPIFGRFFKMCVAALSVYELFTPPIRTKHEQCAQRTCLKCVWRHARFMNSYGKFFLQVSLDYVRGLGFEAL